MMKNRRKRGDVVLWSRFFWCTLFVVFSTVVFSGFFYFSNFRRCFGGSFQPELRYTWRNPVVEAVFGDASPLSSSISIRETVTFPDQTLLFLKYPSSAPLFTKDDLTCVFSTDNNENNLKKPPFSVDRYDLRGQIVRCPPCPRGYRVSLVAAEVNLTAGPTHRWDSLVYEAVIGRDNATVVFVKGLNLRPDRASDASRYECVYGWDFANPKLLLRSEVISAAQEIVRCRTPLSVLNGHQAVNGSAKVSVRVKGSGTLESVAHPVRVNDPTGRKQFELCVCTMMRNGAQFLREWVMYHARIGVQRWFIYDNNSDDDIVREIEGLLDRGYKITRHVWPWIKTQEAGFAHCAIRAQDKCKWVGFIDVDEFFHLPSGLTLHDVIRNYTEDGHIGELRSSCYSFGPSGLKTIPRQGVTVGYICRLLVSERHKSIIRPEVLNSTLVNVVHHFHLKDGFTFVDIDRSLMVINHYKYQVWQVFKEKFYRRVATYVADWQNEQNVGSKDRVPGLGTRPVEPQDWSSKFCEVMDTGLRDRVLEVFADPKTHRLPWQKEGEEVEEEISMIDKKVEKQV